ncbi:hypothetical protein PR202_ga23432 [Eleusine coracana subsp. coracana]|uniref:Uncharacterized protein n=1 Tax=Eleusine coracana subsp. coracana TaxID=191504 RepID=A0AAV5D6G0_ELECO|nr:hypothetical protein PR202_ga23432 [Eleusine coracana subsp. coracana]
MKLLVDTKARRVLFAEVSKLVADFFLSFLAMPLATVVDMVGKDSASGSVGNLYASVENLDRGYLQPGAAKDALLRPTMLTSPAATSSLFAMADPSMPAENLVRCTGISNLLCREGVARTPGTICPACGLPMTEKVEFVRPVTEERGLVKGAATYTMTDNLTIAPVTPVSAIPSAALLHSLGVRDLSALQEKTEQIYYQKLVVDVAAQRVVFAEAGKGVVDFLFSLLALPLSRVAKLVADTGGAEELGAVGNLRSSVAAMDPAYVQPGAGRESLLSPVVLSPPAHIGNSFRSLKRKLYTCNSIYSAGCGTFVTDGKGTPCPSCGDMMKTVTRYVPPGRSGQSQLLHQLSFAAAGARHGEAVLCRRRQVSSARALVASSGAARRTW